MAILKQIALAAALVCANQAALGSSQASGSDSPFGVVSHFLHVNDFYAQYSSHWRISNTLPLMKELGVDWVHEQLYAVTDPRRTVVSAGSTDPAYNAAVQRNRRKIDDWLTEYDSSGLKLVVAVVGAPPKDPRAEAINEEFSSWVAELVQRHKSIHAIQLHNEPNLRHFWTGTPEDYVETFRPFAAKLKAARPDIRIAVGAVSSLSWPPARQWFARAAKAGVLDFADAVSVHPYHAKWRPETDPFYNGAPSDDPAHAEKAIFDYTAWLKKLPGFRAGTGLFFTEFGYSTASNGLASIGDENVQAAFLARTVLRNLDLQARGVPIEAAFWYDLKDDGTSPDKGEHNFGLVSYDLKRRKPAFVAYQSIIRFFRNTSLAPVPSPAPAFSTSSNLTVKSWRRSSDGRVILAFWRNDDRVDSGSDTKATVTLVNADAYDRQAQIHSAEGTVSMVELVVDREKAAPISVRLSAMPQWVVLSPKN